MQLRYNYRLYPAPGQRQALARAFGCARVVFSDALCARQDAHAAGRPYLTDGELPAGLTAARASPERAWLGGVSAVVLQQALADLTAAYRNFFASAAGTRKGPRAAGPGWPSRCTTPAVGVHGDAGVQGRQARAHVRPDRPVRAHQPAVLGLRD
jgi:putative transposase